MQAQYFTLGFEINCKSHRKKITRLNITTKDKSIFQVYPMNEQTLCPKNHSKHGKRVKMKDHLI